MIKFDEYNTPELQDLYSDYYKDVHGFRPSVTCDRELLISQIEGLDHYMESMKATPEGRAMLIADGWEI